MTFQSLPGFREFYPDDCAIRNYIFNIWRNCTRQFGFEEFEAPLLEPLELFTAKSGEEIQTQLFEFKDKKGRSVALRPEMTPSLARLVGARLQSLKRPIKWFSVGENFRYERQQKGRLRSFYQLNADLLGEQTIGADTEILALLIQLLLAFGLTKEDFCIRLSDRDLWQYFLESKGISTEALPVALSIIDKLEREPKEKIQFELDALLGSPSTSLLQEIDTLTKIQSFDNLSTFFSEIKGTDAMQKRLENWAQLLQALEAMQFRQYIRIDLSIVRGLAYYTGFVFEAFQTQGGRALAGGGRYDTLLRKLTGQDLPAVGFGMGDVTLWNLLKEKKLLPVLATHPDLFVVISNEKERFLALNDIAQMRLAGYHVEYFLKKASLGKQLKQADQLGARFALIYGEEERAQEGVTVRDLVKREEFMVPREELVKRVGFLLTEK